MTLPPHNPARFAANAPVCVKCPHRNVDVCGKDSVPLHLHADTGYCPLSLLPAPGDKPDGWESLAREPGKPAPAPADITPADWGPKMWREIHTWAVTADLSTAAAYIDATTARIPCGPCREHWQAAIIQNPPDLSSNAALCRWTHRMHERVNRSLGKPAFAYGAGIAMYGWPE